MASSPTWLFDAFSIVRCPPGYSALFSLYVALLISAALHIMTVFCRFSCKFFFLTVFMGVANPRDRAYPECSFARCATAWDPLSDPPIVLVYSPCLTDCASSPREHRLAGRCRAAGRAPSGQEGSKPQGWQAWPEAGMRSRDNFKWLQLRLQGSISALAPALVLNLMSRLPLRLLENGPTLA